ncbi:glycosyltransferase [Flagellimonas sp.]|uniref:glycosyltransferase n=1 Tax=Flagellimonas sp. TaxID=2058762 RepID=UPI003BA90E8D
MNENSKEEKSLLLIVPFHDWRKIQMEGCRTRDSHFIEEFSKKSVTKLIINRPTTLLEIYLKRRPGLIRGKLILKKGSLFLYKLDDGLYLIDYVSIDIPGQLFKKFKWFIDRYGDKKLIAFIKQSMDFIGVKENACRILNQNIFASKLNEKIDAGTKVFDAWDNFLKFDVYKSIRDRIEQSYTSFGKSCDLWITNSIDNIGFFKERFHPKEIHLIKNGVDLNRFSKSSLQVPNDLQEIPRPIAGFGGKITHLIDVELLNDTIRSTPNVSFVVLGQILDKDVYEAIEKADNFYYLGDKHYDQYPDYVKNFDICIVPYVVDETRKSGANTIKVYEYLATGNKVVGTPSNGLEDLEKNVYLVKSPEQFSKELQNNVNEKERLDLIFHSWKNKTDNLMVLLGMDGE